MRWTICFTQEKDFDIQIGFTEPYQPIHDYGDEYPFDTEDDDD